MVEVGSGTGGIYLCAENNYDEIILGECTPGLFRIAPAKHLSRPAARRPGLTGCVQAAHRATATGLLWPKYGRILTLLRPPPSWLQAQAATVR